MTLNSPRDVREQYKDSSNLAARAALHTRFSVNPYGWNQWVFDHIDVSDSARILEVGCGPGYLWRTNAGRVGPGWCVVATDLSVGMAAEMRAAIDDARFAFGVADAQDLPFADGTFQLVVANHMLYHVSDLDRGLREFARVLAPGGQLFAATNGQRHTVEIREAIGGEWSYLRTFGLEDGPGEVAKHFDEVSVERYEDAFDVTEVEPVLDYVRSMSSFPMGDGGALENLRRRATEAIEKEGVFRIQKDAGLIIGTRP